MKNLHQEALYYIAKTVAKPVNQYPAEGGINSGALCPCFNCKMHCPWPILASWLADHILHANVMGIEYMLAPSVKLQMIIWGHRLLCQIWNLMAEIQTLQAEIR